MVLTFANCTESNIELSAFNRVELPQYNKCLEFYTKLSDFKRVKLP